MTLVGSAVRAPLLAGLAAACTMSLLAPVSPDGWRGATLTSLAAAFFYESASTRIARLRSSAQAPALAGRYLRGIGA